MPVTYEPISSQTLSSAASSITFSSIPSTWTDLRLIFVGKSTNTGTGSDALIMRYNSDTANNYSYTHLRGDGTSVSANTYSNQTSLYGGEFSLGGSPGPSMTSFDIFSYSGNTYKSCLITNASNRNGAGWVYNFVGLWRSTSAITSITLSSVNYTMAIGTTATLYGIKAA